MKNKRALIIAVLMAGFAVFIGHKYINKRISEVIGPYEKLQVVVATKDINMNERIDSSMLAIENVPKKFVQPGSISDPKQAINYLANVNITQGEQILENKLSELEDKFIALRIPPGQRAVTIAVNNITGVGGLPRPGNRVDIIAIYDYTTTKLTEDKNDRSTMKIMDIRARTVFQNILVLAVGRDFKFVGNPLSQTGDSKNSSANSITLALTPRQAQQVTLAQRISTLSLTLRRHSATENDVIDIPQDTIHSVTGSQEPLFPVEKPRYLEIRGGGSSSLTY
ncbi:MAG: Flp pilus assembly protein CpaB [Pseudomonadota bacterium]